MTFNTIDLFANIRLAVPSRTGGDADHKIGCNYGTWILVPSALNP